MFSSLTLEKVLNVRTLKSVFKNCATLTVFMWLSARHWFHFQAPGAVHAGSQWQTGVTRQATQFVKCFVGSWVFLLRIIRRWNKGREKKSLHTRADVFAYFVSGVMWWSVRGRDETKLNREQRRCPSKPLYLCSQSPTLCQIDRGGQWTMMGKTSDK